MNRSSEKNQEFQNYQAICHLPVDVDFPIASAVEDPFFIDFYVTCEHEHGEKIVGHLGFYKGYRNAMHVWSVRFRPMREGMWTLRSHSSLKALDNIVIEVLAKENKSLDYGGFERGAFKVDPHYSQSFVDGKGRPFVPLGFECDWLFSYHQRNPEKCLKHLRLFKESGFNYIVMNVYVHSFWNEEKCPAEDLYTYPKHFIFEGSNQEPDHKKMNPDFFNDFDKLMGMMQEEGIVAHLLLQAQNKSVNWPKRYSPEDDLFWKYIVARYQAFNHIVFDIGKEPFNVYMELGNHDYNIRQMNAINMMDSYKHFVQCHDWMNYSQGHVCELDQLSGFVSDQVHLLSEVDYNRDALAKLNAIDKPYLNIEYGYELGVDPIEPYIDEEGHAVDDLTMLKWTYSIYVAGAYAVYYYCNAAWSVIRLEPTPRSFKWYRILKDSLDKIPFNAMKSQNHLVNRGFCLAEKAKAYWVFLPEGGHATLDLSDLPHRFDKESLWEADRDSVNVHWCDIQTGEERLAEIKVKGFLSELKNPYTDKRPVTARVVI